MIDQKILAAVRHLSTFRLGDVVTIASGSQAYTMTVSRPARRSDGAYGSIESTHLTVTMGPGRWATEICAEMVAKGRQSIALAAPDATLS